MQEALDIAAVSPAAFRGRNPGSRQEKEALALRDTSTQKYEQECLEELGLDSQGFAKI